MILSAQGSGAASADSLRAVLDAVFAAPDYRWIERTDPLAFFSRWITALRQWLFDLQEGYPTLYRLMLGAMLVLVVAIFLHAAWVFVRTLQASRVSGGGPPDQAAAPRRDREWYRRQAERLAAEGRFAEAAQHEFLALILALDGRSLLRFHPSKTPAEYGREARLGPGQAA